MFPWAFETSIFLCTIGIALTPYLLDLQATNTHLRIEGDSILREFEMAEPNKPSPRKFNRDRVIYKSRGLRRLQEPTRLVLYDFGEARIGRQTYTDDVQPYVYGARRPFFISFRSLVLMYGILG